MINYLQKSKTHIFVDELLDSLNISGDDAHHMSRVLRLRIGDKITAASKFNVREYEISNISKDEISIAATKSIETISEPEIVLIISLFKIDRLEIAVAKAIEAGASEIVLTKTQYSNISFETNKQEKIMSRLNAIIRGASSQSRRSALPHISYESDLKKVITKYPDLVICDPEGSGQTPKTPVALLIGPEGGFGENDYEQLGEKEKWKISENIYRAETAAIVSVALVSYNSNK
jgi:16S rRNA (uracil1498-N3)-methyltransferase